jgi:class 3 adenylate cyclase
MDVGDATESSDPGASAPQVSTGAILFTDMVDSTALRSRLGDDRADLLRKHHDDLLAMVVNDHRGTVLRWTGDGVKAGFPTASDAVGAAVAIQRAVSSYGTSSRMVAAFQVRVGIGAGELTTDEGGDRRGVAVIEAARLEALAHPGEILATDVVRALGHRRSNVGFELVGERTLKGIDWPVVVHRVIDLDTGTAPPMPRFLVGDQRLPLVGREQHVDEFSLRWNAAKTGTTGLMLVRGQAGIGKTRFVSHCAELAHDNGAIVIAGACSSDVDVPYEPFAMALRAIATLDEQLAAAIETRSGSLARLFPGSTSSHTESQPAVARLELFNAVADLIRRLSRGHPMLLVIDDLHWATAPTVLLLRHLIREHDDQRLVIVATYRDGELDARHPVRELLADIQPAPHTSLIDLAVLTESDVAQMVMSLAPTATMSRVAGIAELVRGESAGNPFFASELLHHLATTGQLDQALDGGRLPIPDSVHSVVTQRLTQLPPGTHEVLTFAAVIGPSFDLEVLASVVTRRPDDVLDLLDEVVRAGLLTELGVDQFAFVHAIVRTALLDGLSATREARAHRRVAEALEARGAEQFDELARHWQLAGEALRSTRHLATAARRDMVALAFESAKARYVQVVDLLSHDPTADVAERAQAWLGLGAATRALGDPTFTQSIARAARLARISHDAELMAEAAAMSTWLGVMFFMAEAPDLELIELCEDAISLLSDSDPMRARLLATLASHLTFATDPGPRTKFIEEATNLAAQHGDPHLTAAVLHAEFACLWGPATLDRREQIARDLGRLARATGDPQLGFLGGFFTAYCMAERGELLASRTQLLQLESIVEATGSNYYTFLVERLVLTIDLARCVPEAQLRVDSFLAKFGATQADTEGTWMLHTGILAYQAGNFGQMVSSAQAMTSGAQSKMWTSAHALALLWAGDHDGAQEILDQSSDHPRNYFWLVVKQAMADVAAGLGRRDRCQQLFDELLPFRGRMGITGAGSVCFGLVSRTLGMLALALDDAPAAVDLLSEAIEHADRVGAVFEAVTSRRMLATALLPTGDSERASSLLHAALPVAEAHRFEHELDLINELAAGVSTKEPTG